jgi:hypothetical protein
MRNQISNIHNTTRRFNTHTQENLKEYLTVHSKSQKPDAHRKKQPYKSDGEVAEPELKRKKRGWLALFFHGFSDAVAFLAS